MSRLIGLCLPLLCAFIAVMIFGCSGSDRDQATVDPGEVVEQNVDAGEQAVATGGLGDLRAIIDEVRTPSQVVRYRTGMDYLPDLPAPGISMYNKSQATFDAQTTESGMAYGIYAFNLGGMDSATFEARWYSSDGQSGSSYYLGVANFEKTRWDWFEVGFNDQFDLPDTDACQQSDGLALVAVLLTGSQKMVLGTMAFTLNQIYDEIEPNSSPGEAQLLPPMPVYGFSGDVGYIIYGAKGYDGSDSDYFEINAEDGDEFTISLILTDSIDTAGKRGVVLENSDGLVHSFVLSSTEPITAQGLQYDASKAPYILSLTGNRLAYQIYVVPVAAAEAPVAVLSAGPTTGTAPLTVSFDAGASYDTNPGGSIVRYDWDFEGDGVWDATGSEPEAEFTYTEDGYYLPVVRVGNNLGLARMQVTSTSEEGNCTVTVGDTGYDEVESNDGLTPGDYNQLPEVPFSGYLGNVGQDSSKVGPAYDGDWQDCFTFQAQAGRPYSFVDENFNEGGSLIQGDNISYSITDMEGNCYAIANDYRRSISFTPYLTGEYILRIGAGSNRGSHDYSLNGMNCYPPDYFVIQADTDCGVAPLIVNLSVEASDRDSASLSYGWSYIGMYPEEEYGYESTATMTFDEQGANRVYCFVTDDTGLRRIQYRNIYVWSHPYEEREPNDNKSYAQLLEDLPVSGFRGNLSGGEFSSYNGSNTDMFKLGVDYPVGGTLNLGVAYETPSAAITLVLLDVNGNALAQGTAADGVAQLAYTVSAGDTQPYIVSITDVDDTNPGFDYTLSISGP